MVEANDENIDVLQLAIKAVQPSSATTKRPVASDDDESSSEEEVKGEVMMSAFEHAYGANKDQPKIKEN